MSFQKDRRLSVSTKVPKNFARTPPPAFLFPDQRFQRPEAETPPNRLTPVPGGGGVLDASVFRVKQFFLKNFLFTKPLRKERRRRLSSESRSPCQPGFSAFLQFRKPKLPTPTENRRDNQKVSPSMHFSDSIEARRLTDPTTRGKRLFQTPPQTKPRKINSEARRASPSPSEVAIYKLTPRTTRHK